MSLPRFDQTASDYARIKREGKEIRRSLCTTDRDLTKRKLRELKDEHGQIDRSQGKLTLRELCDEWLETIQDSKPKTLEQKSYIAARIKEHWPTGSLVQVAKIKPSECDKWLVRCAQKSRNGFGASSRNAHIQILKEVCALALRDRIISSSPAAHLKYVKREKPIRMIPTWERVQSDCHQCSGARCSDADAEDSADFLEFSRTRGTRTSRRPVRLRLLMSILRPDSIITYRHKTSLPASPFRYFRRCAHYWNDCAKGKCTTRDCYRKFPMRKRR